MTTTDDDFIAEMHYFSVDRMLHKLTHKFRRLVAREGYDEVRAEVNLAYAQAYATWDARRGRLTTWVYRHVRNRLCKLDRDAQSRARRHPTVHFSQTDDARDVAVGLAAPQRFNLNEYLTKLTADARLAATAALETPGEPTADGIANALASLGWGGERVLEAFHDAREALYR